MASVAQQFALQAQVCEVMNILHHNLGIALEFLLLEIKQVTIAIQQVLK